MWQLEFETSSHDEMRKHATEFAKTLTREGDAEQVSLAVERATALADTLGAKKYRAIIGGHATEDDDKPKQRMPNHLHVQVIQTDPPPAKGAPPATAMAKP